MLKSHVQDNKDAQPHAEYFRRMSLTPNLGGEAPLVRIKKNVAQKPRTKKTFFFLLFSLPSRASRSRSLFQRLIRRVPLRQFSFQVLFLFLFPLFSFLNE